MAAGELEQDCSIARTLEVIGDRWTLLILRDAFRGVRRFDELQRDLDSWLAEYNEVRPHQGRWCYGKTPMQTFIASLPLAREKVLAAQ